MTHPGHGATTLTFAERYQITSTRGRVYTREMLLNAATRCWLARTSKVARAEIAAVLDDDTFMRWRRGEIPARVAEEAVLETMVRLGAQVPAP